MTERETLPSAAGERDRLPLLDLPRPDRWHRPLVIFAATMFALTLVTLCLALVDQRQLTGQNIWFKPLKFSISMWIYSISLAWLIGQFRTGRRLANLVGTVTVIALAIEIVIIVGAATLDTTSHFNTTSPLHTTAWTVMAVSITVAWVMTFLLAALLTRQPLGDSARTAAVRCGVVLALIGMALAFLMAVPNPSVTNLPDGIAGAHTVGLPDGGPGLPFLGWSTVGGDLRIGHFLGMHGLQAIPLLLLMLEALGRRGVRPLGNVTTRRRLVLLASAGYLAVSLLLTWQALIGQSIVAPAGPIPIAAAALAVALLAALLVILRQGGRITPESPQRRAPSSDPTVDSIA